MTTAGLDLSHAFARRILPRQCPALRLIQVGCGGIGGMLAIHTARLARECQRQYDSVEVFFIDPDIVEEKNIRRQNFCYAEIGHNKAETLAYRLTAAWGLDITAIAKPFSSTLIPPAGRETLTILLGCVDNAAARTHLHRVIQRESQHDASPVWWLDGANGTVQGQILLGNTVSADLLTHSFDIEGLCKNLPSPALVHPELLIPKPDESLPRTRSCAELAIRDPQSLTINSIIASHMSDYLLRLVLSGDLRRFATYIDMATGSVRSLATTPDQLHQALAHRPTSKRQRSLVD